MHTYIYIYIHTFTQVIYIYYDLRCFVALVRRKVLARCPPSGGSEKGGPTKKSLTSCVYVTFESRKSDLSFGSRFSDTDTGRTCRWVWRYKATLSGPDLGKAGQKKVEEPTMILGMFQEPC